MLDPDGSGWQSGANQMLLFQTMSGDGAAVGCDPRSAFHTYVSDASDLYTWTNRLAQQWLRHAIRRRSALQTVVSRDSIGGGDCTAKRQEVALAWNFARAGKRQCRPFAVTAAF
jgi:hypothetical protein